jgi:hypothetical protein
MTLTVRPVARTLVALAQQAIAPSRATLWALFQHHFVLDRFAG